MSCTPISSGASRRLRSARNTHDSRSKRNPVGADKPDRTPLPISTALTSDSPAIRIVDRTGVDGSWKGRPIRGGHGHGRAVYRIVRTDVSHREHAPDAIA